MLEPSSSEDESDDEIRDDHPTRGSHGGRAVPGSHHDHPDGGTGPSLAVPGAGSSLPG